MSRVARRALLFTRQQVHTLTNLSLRTIDRHIKAGRLDAEMIGGRKMITRESLLGFVPGLTEAKLDAAFGPFDLDD